MCESIFKNLNGTFDIERTITPHGRFVGQGRFTLDAQGIAYYEKGDLTLEDGRVIEGATKRYLYKLEADTIAVYFADGVDKGKLFHRLGFIDPNNAVASYPCGDDFYETTYAFDLPQGFTITHKVTGKKKDYTSMSVYRRKDLRGQKQSGLPRHFVPRNDGRGQA